VTEDTIHSRAQVVDGETPDFAAMEDYPLWKAMKEVDTGNHDDIVKILTAELPEAGYTTQEALAGTALLIGSIVLGMAMAHKDLPPDIVEADRAENRAMRIKLAALLTEVSRLLSKLSANA